MKGMVRSVGVLLGAAELMFSTEAAVAPATGVPLSIKPHPDGLEVAWPSQLRQPDGTVVFPHFELQVSDDLARWQPVGDRVVGDPSAPGERFTVLAPANEQMRFYRVQSVVPRAEATLASDGADMFGYANALDQARERIGQISLDEFTARFPPPTYPVDALSWDVTTARFWDLFDTDITVHNQGKTFDDPNFRHFNTRLSPDEFARFKKNGFVVSRRLARPTFADVYYLLWKDDLPVFISTDSILQAWHRTFDAMLEELEETLLANLAARMLDGMAIQLPAAWTQATDGVLKDALLDADLFIAVARSLLTGARVPSALGQDGVVAQTLADVQALQMKPVTLFGSCRVMDFSQFRPRGHYERSETLGRYFQAVMWLGRTDLAIAGGPFDRGCGAENASPRELAMAIALWHLLNQAGELDAWRQFDRVIQGFVGWTDSMTPMQLGQLLNAAGVRSLADARDLATLERLQADILAGRLGAQNIRSDYFIAPTAGEIQLPRAFTLFGQKFTPDSWTFSQTVFDSIDWTENGATVKVPRRVPSALDVAFAVLGNDAAVPWLVSRIANTNASTSKVHAVRFRDGLPYQHQLAALRTVMDSHSTEAWDSNLYMNWLACLRELSAPVTDARYPEAMRTRAWAMKNINTQLASWTHLRHNTILYVKQSYTGGTVCFYPAGFVEPNVAFWDRLQRTANRAIELLSGADFEATAPLVRSNQIAHLTRFSDTVGRLRMLAAKELDQEPFTESEEQFVRDLIQINWSSPFSGAVRLYTGWYPRLFYRPVALVHMLDEEFHTTYGADTYDGIVADVHTDVPCPDCGDEGAVLHQGIGLVNLLLIAVDNGPHRMVFAGPLLSHYEFEVLGGPRRLTDSEWRAIRYQHLFEGTAPFMGPPDDVPLSRLEGLEPPEWTREYLAR